MSDRLTRANAIRFLSMDAVQRANSGHPGMPMGMADMAEVLWHDFLRHNPNNPQWPNRDRFILSNGHGSMLLYSLLHLTGYDVDINEIKNFRQWGSKTPGHPELGDAPGVETTTGPLGQGLANAVGMAMAERHMAAQFNQKEFNLIDHFTYVFCGDGCLMEGISHEACSLAGTLGLGKLICFYDDNQISIDGDVDGWFRDDTPKRFEAYGWHVIKDIDGHDPKAIHEAIVAARAVSDKPSILCCKTVIGFGSPNLAGSEKTHGAALGDEEIKLVRENLNWPHEPFSIPETIYSQWDNKSQGAEINSEWDNLFENYKNKYPELASEFTRRINNNLPDDWEDKTTNFIKQTQADSAKMATRKASQVAINFLSDLLPEFMGGSADLTGSNLTKAKDATVFDNKNPQGNYVYYGVREFGMSAIANGMALYGGVLPFVGTFLTFCDYARNAVRMAALMKQRVVFVYTHDSIGLGEDGPTHQAVEHAAMLRLTPNVHTWRPADVAETAVAWQQSIEHKNNPSCLLLSRQGLVHQDRDQNQINNIKKGGYVLFENNSNPEIILIATGSEVDLAYQAALKLAETKNIRLVSMPCTELFLTQDKKYQESVLPSHVKKRVAIEAGSADYWYRFVGLDGKVIGMNSFGASAPAEICFEKFGFTVENIINTVNNLD